MNGLELAGGGLVAWSGFVTATSLTAVVRSWRQRRPRPGARLQPGRWPSVVVVRPCAGLEPHLQDSLRSTGRIRYPGALRVVFSTSSATDEALPVTRRVAAQLRHEGLDASVSVVPPRGPNRKTSQLAGIVDAGSDEVVVVVDSDVDMTGDELESLVEPLRCSETMGATWCAPVELDGSTVADRLSARILGASLHAFTLLGPLDRGGLVGKTFALRSDALRAIGGFGALVDYLGEDMELARRLRARGWQTAQVNAVVTSLASNRSLAQVVARYARWLMVIRAQRPARLVSYPLLLAATPLLVVGAAVAMLAGVPWAGGALASVLLVRLAVALVARHWSGQGGQHHRLLVDGLLADGVLLLAFGRAAFGPRRVRWRQRELSLGPGGVLERSEPRDEGPRHGGQQPLREAS